MQWACLPSKSIFARKRVAALFAQVITLLQVYLKPVSKDSSRLQAVLKNQTHTLLVAHQIGLSIENPTAVSILTLVHGMSFVVRLHVRPKIVGALEQLSANSARADCLFGSCEATFWLTGCIQHAWVAVQ